MRPLSFMSMERCVCLPCPICLSHRGTAKLPAGSTTVVRKAPATRSSPCNVSAAHDAAERVGGGSRGDHCLALICVAVERPAPRPHTCQLIDGLGFLPPEPLVRRSSPHLPTAALDAAFPLTDILWRSSALSTRTPEPVVAGLMWFTPARNVPDSYRRIRHACEQNQVDRYGWQAHDGATFGTHELVDGSTTLTTSFVKYPGGYKGTGHD